LQLEINNLKMMNSNLQNKLNTLEKKLRLKQSTCSPPISHQRCFPSSNDLKITKNAIINQIAPEISQIAITESIMLPVYIDKSMERNPASIPISKTTKSKEKRNLSFNISSKTPRFQKIASPNYRESSSSIITSLLSESTKLLAEQQVFLQKQLSSQLNHFDQKFRALNQIFEVSQPEQTDENRQYAEDLQTQQNRTSNNKKKNRKKKK
jgi:hypothetical protein